MDDDGGIDNEGVTLFVTPTGKKYHRSGTCPGFSTATRIMKCTFCEECSGIQQVGRYPLYGRGSGYMLHVSWAHALTVFPNLIKQCDYCARCSTM